MKFKLIYLICMILCVLLTFSTVNAAELNQYDLNSAVIDSQSESSFTNLNEDMRYNILKSNEDEDCVDSVNGLSNLNNDLTEKTNSKSRLSSINSDENSLKSTISPSGNTFASIQDSIASAKSGDTINLNGRKYIGNGTIITINKELTISGGQGSVKAILDAKELSGIFKITAPNVKLINCNFINSNDRAVYFMNNNGSISNCDFNNNFAIKNSHLLVDSNCTNFLLENSSFSNGYTLNYTNVAVLAHNSTVRDCSFINNTVNNSEGKVSGAGLQIGQDATTMNIGTVVNCIFINNSAISNLPGTHAGALCFRPGIRVFNSTFIKNYCSGVGGATTLHEDGELFNCIFINNRAGEYGGAICTGFSGLDISVNISSCIFENNSAPIGGAIQVKGDNVKVINSTFKGNNATATDGGALYIVGKDALIINSSFDKNYAENIGAGVLINGSDVSILNSSFDDNIASFGAAIYVVGSNANIFSSNFTNHNVTSGSVYIKGPNTYVYDSNFLDNQGENGAAIYINGSLSNLILNNFTLNNASKKGGAVFIEGSNANIIASNFLNNSAIPDISDMGSGLGGAIYIKGNNNTIDNSQFSFNTARNGSAIYTDGYKMTLSNTDFDKNQAWSYVLDSLVTPVESYYNESDILVNFTLIGGNNIANAIYNTASTRDIYFYNISYISSKGSKITGENEIHPVIGAQNSKNGELLYQDDREDNQLVNVVIFKNPNNSKDLSVYSPNLIDELNMEGVNPEDIILNKTFVTGILGDINFNLSDYAEEALEPGKYIVLAKHFEDDYYKEIDGNNSFSIIPIVDLEINISSSRVNIDFNKSVKYTIKVANNGPNNSTGTIVNAKIPEGLVYVSSTASLGNYDEDSGIWDIGDLNIGDTQTLVINLTTNRTGIIDYPVSISSDEEDTNEKNNFNNKSIRVLMADLAIDVEASGDEFNYGDNVDWTITVKNNGPNNASKLVVSILPFEEDLIYLNASNNTFNSSSFIWEIPSLLVDEEISLMITTKVNGSNKIFELPANVSSETYDVDFSNNLDSDAVKVLPLCDLIIKVNVSEDSLNCGDIVDWNLIVSNDGPDMAENVSVSLSDLESLGLNILEVSDDSFDDESYEWFIGDLDNGQTASLTISTGINTSNKDIPLEVTVFSDTFEENLNNNHDNDSIRVNPLCDLIVDVSCLNSTVNYGDTIDWTVLVSNDGPDNAQDVIVSLSDLESLGLNILDVSDDSFDKNTYEWTIGDLNDGESLSLSITTQAKRSNDNITVSSQVKTSTYELELENNIDSDSVYVLPACDIVISIIPDNSLVNETDVVNWIINVTNNGPDNASDVNVFNSLPEGLEYVFSESSIGELEEFPYEDGTGMDFIWKVGDLANNESAYLIISTNTLEEGEFLNNASAETSTNDLNQSNNFDSSVLEVIAGDNSSQSDDNPGDEGSNDNGNNDGNNDRNGDRDNDGNSDADWDNGYPYPNFDDDLDKNNDLNNNSDNNNSDDSSKKNSKSLRFSNNGGNSKKPIDISSRKTGNPLAIAILSIFALLIFPFRKN